MSTNFTTYFAAIAAFGSTLRPADDAADIAAEPAFCSTVWSTFLPADFATEPAVGSTFRPANNAANVAADAAFWAAIDAT